MEKIGIITFYYNSINYGGVLQAYALEAFLIQNGYKETEQICYRPLYSTKLNKLFNLKKVIGRISNKLSHRKFKSEYAKSLLGKQESFKDFTEGVIKHSDCVYNAENIEDAVKEYDFFIVGSDQVWNIDN